MQAYREVFGTGNARLVMTPDNQFLRYLQAAPVPGSVPSPGPTPPCLGRRQWPLSRLRAIVSRAISGQYARNN